MKKLIKRFFYLCLLIVLLLLLINIWIVQSTKKQIYSSTHEIPSKEIGLVLGTSKYLVGGGTNQFFKNRVLAAAKLYKKGKIKHILVSGDNRTKYYNEPKDMYDALRELGIPDEAITLDYAGLRTLDSVIRSKAIFGQDKITIITQRFHAYRAAYIANHYGLEANCYVAEDPNYRGAARVFVREYLARVRAILDLYILDSKPKHMGNKEVIEIANLTN